MNLIVFVFFLICYFYLLFKIAHFFVGKGSDHSFYEFYTLLIKKNKNNFFFYYPNFLNKMPIVDPQFFFKILSYFSKGQLKKVAFLLNPIILSLLLVVSFLMFNYNFKDLNFFILILIFFISFTPHFFHQQNSRIYGLSVRGVGLLLILIFFWSFFLIQYSNNNLTYILISLFTGYLIWGSNLFAQQSVVFSSFLWFFIFGDPMMLILITSSLFALYVFHPSYTKIFLKTRINYGKIYFSVLSEKFLFNYRYSIWRDWIYDFWFKKEKSLITKLSYIYNNSIFIVVFLNPLFLLAVYSYFNPIILDDYYFNEIYLFSTKISLIAFVIFLCTSLRLGRFLGEPERYIEAVIPFSTFVSCIFIFSIENSFYAYFIIAYFIGLNIFQILTFVFFRKFHPQDITKHLTLILKTVNQRSKDGVEIRFTSNNMDWTKFLLNPNWKFVNYIPVVDKCGSVFLKDLVDNYPFINSNSFQTISNEFNLNFLLIDKTLKFDYSCYLKNPKSYKILIEKNLFY